MKEFYAYLYINITGIPIYVGKGHGNRAWEHGKTKRNTHIGNYIRKAKSNGIDIEPIIYKCLDEEMAFFIEEELIRKYGRADLGTGTLFNLTDGGEGVAGYIFTEKDKDKISKASKGKAKPIRSKEHCDNISKSNKGRPACNKGIPSGVGRKLSDETKFKMSKPASETAKHNMRKPKPKVTCPHCNKVGGNSLMTRYHFDNCKFKFGDK